MSVKIQTNPVFFVTKFLQTKIKWFEGWRSWDKVKKLNQASMSGPYSIELNSVTDFNKYI